MGNDSSDQEVVYTPPVYIQVGQTNQQIQARIRQQQADAAAAQAEVIRKTQQLQQERQRLLAQQRQRQRIEQQNFAIAEKKRFQQYLQNLGMMNLQAYIPKIVKGQKHYAVIGPISSGKTTFLNSIFSINEEVGIGETTRVAKPVYRNEISKIIVWDVPGINQDFSMYDPNNLGFFHCCDKIFILYKDSPKRCEHIIKVLNKIKSGQLILLRTQCDNWDNSHSKTLAQELQTDKQILQEWGINVQQFLQHSSYQYGFDNDRIKNLISN